MCILVKEKETKGRVFI